MKIAIIGAGAMGSIYGSKLSTNNEVYLIDLNSEIVNDINQNGIFILEADAEYHYYPKATTDSVDLPAMDLVILFVKSMFSEVALESNKHLIGKDTYLMALQNGAGHEDVLQKFAAIDHVIIGTTEDSGTTISLGKIRRGGVGNTNIGMLVPDKSDMLALIKDSFDNAGFKVTIHANIQQLIWNKLIINSSLSATTGVLKSTMGYLVDNQYANNMMMALLDEVCNVAQAMGLKADKQYFTQKIVDTILLSKMGITSISADLQNGRKTEVDKITGAVVRAGQDLNVPVKTHEFVLNTIHALESQ